MYRNPKSIKHEEKRCRNTLHNKHINDKIDPGTSRSARKQAETLVRRSEAEREEKYPVNRKPDNSPQIEEFDDCALCDCADGECLNE